MPSADKENASKQALLKFTSKTNAKKRTLSVKDVELNLDDTTIPVTKEVVEAMRQRIIELEDELESQPPAKRAKTTKDTDIALDANISAKAAPQPATDKAKAKADAKKVDALLKKFWSSLQKEVKTDKYKFRGEAPKTAKVEEVIEEEEFSAIFDGKGVQIQPTPANKPTSTVIIKDFPAGDVEALFGNHYKGLKGNCYSAAGGFQKVFKLGQTELRINHLQVTYAKNTMKCTMKFEVEEASGPYCAPRSRRGYWTKI